MAQVLPKHRAREYETIFIMHPDTPVDTIEQVAGRMTDVVEKLEGKLIRVENWGKRRLAYAVKKQHKGIYIYLRYLGYSDIVNELERVMRLLEPVLKYLTVKLEEDVDPEARPTEEISFLPSYPEERERAKEKREEKVEAVEPPPTAPEVSDKDDKPAGTDEPKAEEAKAETKEDGKDSVAGDEAKSKETVDEPKVIVSEAVIVDDTPKDEE